MAYAYFYENLVYQSIASNLGLKLEDFRFLPGIIPLPESGYELFALLDGIPTAAPVFAAGPDDRRFSGIYGALLQSQPDSFIVSVARANYENEKYWLPQQDMEMSKTPLYTPSSASISAFIAGGGSLDYKLDSSAYPPPSGVLYPCYPDIVVDQPFRLFNQIAQSSPFVFRMRFDRLVFLPVRPGGWFSQAVFTQAYASRGAGWQTGPGTVTWEELFGGDGILKYVCNGVLAVSGIFLELQSFGEYDSTIFESLKENGGTSVWPYYLGESNLNQDYAMGEDGSITITTTLPSPEILLFLIEAADISALTGRP